MAMKIEPGILPSSFRDPGGFLFRRGGVLYRQINDSCREDYDCLMQSGLYDKLISRQALIPHEEVDIPSEQSENAYIVIQPEEIPFVSYPYEWSFSQLKEAALVTLDVERIALKYGMTLKDASAYNIQFHEGRALFIDTLSFERHREGDPWVAYRQFCQHFLAPLALMAHRDIRLGQLLRVYIDGVPLDLASSLLPGRTRLKPGIAMHIHMHAKSQTKHADTHETIERPNLARNALLGLLDSLANAVKGLSWQPAGTEWADYYTETNYSTAGLEHKKKLVGEFLDLAQPRTVWDLGANVGVFSRLASDRGIPTVAFDIDPACVELNTLDIQKNNEQNLLPLMLDLTNPSPGIGWQNAERDSLIGRGPVDMVFALALIHHLAISNNVPFERIAGFFAEIADYLVIEFVPKTDSQVRKLLANREDVFADYSQDVFEEKFGEWFSVIRKEPIEDSSRVLYLMKKR